VRLFQTLESFEHSYRPGIVQTLQTEDILHVWDFPNLWGYARDLFQTPGFIDDIERYQLGFIPDETGKYVDEDLVSGSVSQDNGTQRAAAERWNEDPHRSQLQGSPYYSGPGVGGSYELWNFGVVPER
jgi:putative glutathione S-transferase